MIIALLFVLASIYWLIGFGVLWSIPNCQREKGSTSIPKLSIVIPARDEEDNLKTLLPSITQQTIRAHDIIVVDDHSQDKTAQIAKQYGAKVITSQPLPDKWLGKAWACQQGAQAAGGEVLLFLDADTKIEPDGLVRLMTSFLSQPQVLSISPYHRVPTWAEQGSAFFNLLQLMGMRTFTLLGQKLKPAGMFGPCLMISQSDYNEIGGHGAVVGEVLENYALAKPLMAAGKKLNLVNGKGTVSVRMYPKGIKAVIAGWTKSFSIGAAQTPPLLMTMITFWLTGLIVAMNGVIVHLSGGPANAWWVLLYGLYALQLILHLKRIGSYSVFTALLFPLPLIFFFYIYTNAMIIKRRGLDVNWKGRKIKQ